MSIFNHYKLKRKWGRAREKIKTNVLNQEDKPWQAQKITPPKPSEKKNQILVKIELFLVLFCFLATIGVGLYHNFFLINKIEISGLLRIGENEILNTVNGTLDYKKFFFFPAKNYFLTDLSLIKDVIKNRFPVERVVVKKTFPNSLEIMIEEKISNVIYDNGKQYSYLSPDGKVIELLRNVTENEWKIITKTVTSTNEKGDVVSNEEIISKIHTPQTKKIASEIGDLPIVYDKREKEIRLNENALKSETVGGIIKWFNLINKYSDIQFGYIVLNDELGDFLIHTREGWDIKVKNDNIDYQFDQLLILLKENKIDRQHLNYVDLRFGEKIYWQ